MTSEAPHDANARAIGVATGGSGLTELSTAGADIVFPDLADTAAVCAAVFGTLLGDD
jgi:phosphoglycolate phosphatase-like HAD superfamily hydrolase